MVQVKMAMKLRNCQGNRVSECCAQIYAINNTDILEEILVRVPPEYIAITILVSKRWFELVRSASFRELYTRKWSRTLHLVGFKGFYVLDEVICRMPISEDDSIGSYRWENAHRFLSTSKEGDDDNNVDHCTRGGIFGQHNYLIDSTSNGILLIGHKSRPFTFTVWNPYTNKHHQLPQPQENFRRGCVAFEVEYCGKGSFHYKVTRAKVDFPGRAMDPIYIQTFSSKTGRWEEKTFPSSPHMNLDPHSTGKVIGGIIHWVRPNGDVVIYDASLGGNQPLAFISSPEKGTRIPNTNRTVRYPVHCYGESGDGRLQCAHKCPTGMMIRVLEIEEGDYSNYKWILRYKVDFETLRSKNLSIFQRLHDYFGYFAFASFLPRNSEYVLTSVGGEIFMLHIPSENLEHIPCEEVANSSEKNLYIQPRDLIPYFKWVCPWPELITTSF